MRHFKGSNQTKKEKQNVSDSVLVMLKIKKIREKEELGKKGMREGEIEKARKSALNLHLRKFTSESQVFAHVA